MMISTFDDGLIMCRQLKQPNSQSCGLSATLYEALHHKLTVPAFHSCCFRTLLFSYFLHRHNFHIIAQHPQDIMLLPIILLSTLVGLYPSFSCAQYTCLSGGHSVTSDLPSCDYLNNTYTHCSSLTGDALNKCVCSQQLLSSIFELVSSDSPSFRRD